MIRRHDLTYTRSESKRCASRRRSSTTTAATGGPRHRPGRNANARSAPTDMPTLALRNVLDRTSTGETNHDDQSAHLAGSCRWGRRVPPCSAASAGRRARRQDIPADLSSRAPGRPAPPRVRTARVDGGEVWCVLIDRVQSQANRLEEALLAAAEEEGGDGPVPLPFVTVDFGGAGLEPLERITSLDAPHRVYDAILRDSLLDGVPFMQSEEGHRLAAAKPADATALLELSPSALLFGAWHSQGEGGGLGAKFPRALVSEIMGSVPRSRKSLPTSHSEMEARTAGRRTGSRIDPLGTSKDVRIYQSSEEKATGRHLRIKLPVSNRSQFCSEGRRAIKQASLR